LQYRCRTWFRTYSTTSTSRLSRCKIATGFRFSTSCRQPSTPPRYRLRYRYRYAAPLVPAPLHTGICVVGGFIQPMPERAATALNLSLCISSLSKPIKVLPMQDSSCSTLLSSSLSSPPALRIATLGFARSELLVGGAETAHRAIASLPACEKREHLAPCRPILAAPLGPLATRLTLEPTGCCIRHFFKSRATKEHICPRDALDWHSWRARLALLPL
jgi:hypothetical protein